MTTSSAPSDDPLDAGWRIDDLARRAGLTVDTIRYYQREDLLPPATRCGRTNRYGPEHLQRLERIKELQARRFSLAAIRALLSGERDNIVDGVFAERGGQTYDLDEIVERSGIDPDLATALSRAGLLRDPADFGRDAYDADDLDLLRTMHELRRLGLPARVVVELGRIYAKGIEGTERAVIALFTSGGKLEWTAEELRVFRDIATRTASEILPLNRHLVDYLHTRTIQRLTLDAIERGTANPAETNDPGRGSRSA